ncbi:MAG: acyltransferase domain-containing protein [Planctomycetes bacterium]|nr:acyltransferase domain-containing protein [Planctomycetota bacterium]
MNNEIRESRESGEASSVAARSPIAIIGMGSIFPNAHNLKEFWRVIRRAEDGISEVPESHWQINDYLDDEPKTPDMTYCSRGGFLPETAFDPTEWGIPPTAIEATDTAQLLGLVVAKAAIEDAGYQAEPPRGANAESAKSSLREFDRETTSVICGVTGTLELALPLAARLGHPKWRRALREAGVDEATAEDVIARISDAYVPWQESSFPGLLGNVVAGRIANRLDLRGTNCVVDAACASSLSAVYLGVMELESGRAEMVVTGGVDALNDIFMFMCFSKTPALSPTGDARPFSDDADGTVIGEGVGMLVLKRLDDARRDGDRVYAVIRGIGTSSDGRSQSIYAPRSIGQAKSLRRAYAAAGIEPSTVELVEAHGTGTKVGDVVEFDALTTVYRESQSEGSWCGLGTIKSQIGHTKAAAGVAGLIKTALALHYRVQPATLKINKPNPKFDIDSSPFHLNVEVTPWFQHPDHPRRAAVSSFGFGGSNFHVVLEECYGVSAPVAWDGSVQLIALSADTRDGLLAQVEQRQQAMRREPGRDSLAAKANASRASFSPVDPYRLVVVVEEGDDCVALLKQAAEVINADGDSPPHPQSNIHFSGHTTPGKLALLFPGQGSQYVGMGRDLACVFPDLRKAISRADRDEPLSLASRVYPPHAFSDEIAARQKKELIRTDIAQPAIGAVSLGMLHTLRRFGVRADFVVGHSFGELTALHAGGRIDEATFCKLSRLRGRVMAELKGDRGAMLAVRAPIDEVDRMIEEQKLDVVLANRNAPAQAVLSGGLNAIDDAEQACRTRGFRTSRLSVAAAFHSECVADAARPFREALDEFEFVLGEIPVYANTTADPYPEDAGAVRELLGHQLARPVDFVNQIRNLYDAGARTFIEVGPGSVLTGLAGSILGERPHIAAALDASSGRRDGLAELARVLAQLAAAGHPIDLAKWEPHVPAVRKPGMVVPLVGANYRSPQKARPPRVRASTPTATVHEKVAVERQSGRLGGARTSRMTDVQDTRPVRIPASESASSGKTNVSRQKPDGNGGSGDQRPAVRTESHVTEAMVPALPAAATVDGGGILHDAFRVVSEGVRAMHSLQQQTASLHQRFLEGQELAHRTIQNLIESQHQLVERVCSGLPAASASLASGGTMLPPAPAAISSVPAIALQPQPPIGSAPAVSARFESAAVDAPPPTTRTNGNSAPPPPTQVLPAKPDTPAPSVSAAIPPDTLLEVVAELTGYPPDMLNLDMDMEADLGIDSIKRVEILAALEQKLPEFGGVEPEYMGSLRTLRQILEYVASSTGSTTSSVGGPPGPKACEPCDAETDSASAAPKQAAPAVSTEPAAPLIGHGFLTGAVDLDSLESADDEASSEPSGDLRVMFERRIDLERHPFLLSHIIGVRPVVPLAVMVEWLAHAALHENPGLHLIGFENMRVMKGVIIEDRPVVIAVAASKSRVVDGRFAVDVELRESGRDLPHVRATILLAAERVDPPSIPVDRFAAAQPSTLSADDVYNEVLFHGEHFRAIERIDGCDDDGMAAHLVSAPAPSTWMTDPLRSAWLADPLVLDGCLQLGIVWCADRLGSPSLPSFVAGYRQYAGAFPASGVDAVLRVREAARSKLTADVYMRGQRGEIVAELQGCEWTVDPTLASEFRAARRDSVAGHG